VTSREAISSSRYLTILRGVKVCAAASKATQAVLALKQDEHVGDWPSHYNFALVLSCHIVAIEKAVCLIAPCPCKFPANPNVVSDQFERFYEKSVVFIDIVINKHAFDHVEFEVLCNS
jgi:hypothetical protein